MFRSTYKRFATCVLSLFLCIVTLSGCVLRIHDSKYEKGDFYCQKGREKEPRIAAKSNTNTFPIDEVSFKLLYGFYNESDTEFKQYFLGTANDNLIFTLYLCEPEDKGAWYIPCSEIDVEMIIEDYRNIAYHTLVYSYASTKEAIINEYFFATDNKRFIEYHHSETVTIPEKFFKEKNGYFAIHVLVFSPAEESGFVPVAGCRLTSLFYTKTNDNTIELNLSKNKVYIP